MIVFHGCLKDNLYVYTFSVNYEGGKFQFVCQHPHTEAGAVHKQISNNRSGAAIFFLGCRHSDHSSGNRIQLDGFNGLRRHRDVLLAVERDLGYRRNGVDEGEDDVFL